MTCAACAARIEKRLNRLDGVEATVNLATERAAITFDPGRVAVDDLVSAVEQAGYTATVHVSGVEAGTTRRSGARARLVVSSVLTAPIAVLGMVPDAQFHGWEWVALLLSTPVVFWCGAGFHRVAFVQARHGAATMDTLVSIGTLAAWGWSATVLLANIEEDTFFEAAAVITTLILLGRSLETGARSRSRAAMASLLASAGSEVCLLRDGVETIVPSASLRVGDRFVVRPGERVATDGVIVEGASAVDQALLTGEPVPAEVGVGSEVVGGALNTYGVLVVSATRVGSETTLAQIARLVDSAQAGKAPIQHLADRISGVFVPIVMGLSVATLTAWLAVGAGAGAAFKAAVAVLIVACPCALGLATPTALAVGTARGAQLGILLRGPEVLEQARRITTVLLDKTGTVTEGHPSLVDVIVSPGEDRARALLLAGAVEAGSEHPIGRAITQAARAELGPLPPVERFRNLPGSGVSGAVDGLQVEVGQRDGVVTVSWEGAPRATFVLSDAVKPESASAVAGFRALGIEPVLLTGDERGAADEVAALVGIDRVEAGVRPEGKLAEVARRQAAGEVVAMIGDGINDAAALAGADLGIAIGTGADVAKEASDMTLVSGDLGRAVDAVRLARRTLGTIRGNLGWAFVYNIAALPVASLGLLDPMIAAAAMAASSLCVVGNSLRLFRFRPAA